MFSTHSFSEYFFWINGGKKLQRNLKQVPQNFMKVFDVDDVTQAS